MEVRKIDYGLWEYELMGNHLLIQHITKKIHFGVRQFFLTLKFCSTIVPDRKLKLILYVDSPVELSSQTIQYFLSSFSKKLIGSFVVVCDVSKFPDNQNWLLEREKHQDFVWFTNIDEAKNWIEDQPIVLTGRNKFDLKLMNETVDCYLDALI